MTSPQHARWNRLGLQWQLARPLVALRDRLRGYGYIVYDIGDNRHMDHIPPEDHTPYSETGWPGTTPYGWVTAIDIMPPPAGRGLPSLQLLGGQIFDDKQADVEGVAWLKYMNWGPVSDRSAKHDQWQPNHVRSSSGDVGHIHLSCRSTAANRPWTPAEFNYDPVARLRGQHEQSISEEDMPFVAHDAKTDQYYVCDLITSRPVPDEPASVLSDVIYLAQQLNYGHGAEGVEWSHGGWVREGWSEAAFGTLQAKPLKVEVSGSLPVSGSLNVSSTA